MSTPWACEMYTFYLSVERETDLYTCTSSVLVVINTCSSCCFGTHFHEQQ